MPFPMYTVPLEAVLQMSCVEAHERLKAQGLLVEFEKNLGKAIFLSHQWAAKDHPDPTFAQFSVFQDTMKNILSNRFQQIPVNFVSESFMIGAKPLSTQEFKCGKLFIWYDYFSCPQLEKFHGADSNLAKAIASIHAYVTKCSFFFALCPYLEDPAEPARVLNSSTWGNRGWCRLERTMRELSDGSWILIRSAESIELVVAYRALGSPTGEGDFAVASDKAKLGPILQAALQRKMIKSLSQSDFATYRLVRNMQRLHLRNFPAELEIDLVPGFIPSCSSDDILSRVEFFLYQNGFRNIFEVDIAGFMPLHYASLSGEAELIKAMLELRADPRITTGKGQPLLGIPPYVSSLSLALLCGNNDAAQLLIESKAKVQQQGALAPALHMAAFSNNVEGIQILMEAGCDPKTEKSLLGLSAAHFACDGSSFAAFDELVREGVNISGLLHAMAMSSKGGSAEITLRLIELRADINEQWHVRRLTPLGALEALQSLRYRFGKDTALTRLGYHLDGSTPLMAALLLGNYETAMLLLREGARLDLRNARKFSAADLAQGAPKLLQEILQGDSVYFKV